LSGENFANEEARCKPDAKTSFPSELLAFMWAAICSKKYDTNAPLLLSAASESLNSFSIASHFYWRNPEQNSTKFIWGSDRPNVRFGRTVRPNFYCAVRPKLQNFLLQNTELFFHITFNANGILLYFHFAC
jgi:hypothetical protein